MFYEIISWMNDWINSHIRSFLRILYISWEVDTCCLNGYLHFHELTIWNYPQQYESSITSFSFTIHFNIVLSFIFRKILHKWYHKQHGYIWIQKITVTLYALVMWCQYKCELALYPVSSSNTHIAMRSSLNILVVLLEYKFPHCHVGHLLMVTYSWHTFTNGVIIIYIFIWCKLDHR